MWEFWRLGWGAPGGRKRVSERCTFHFSEVLTTAALKMYSRPGKMNGRDS